MQAGTRRPLFVAAAVCAIAFLALGLYVLRFGEPGPLAKLSGALLDHSTLVAWWLTETCYPIVLGPVGIVLLFVAWRVPAWRSRILFSLGALLVCWLASDQLQHLIARPRPLGWVVKRETAFSFPSSHAAISVGFFGLWAWLIDQSDLPGRRVVAWFLVSLMLGILWSRLALGAHYPTDLLGGALLAVALVCAGAGALRR
ncbi:MAG: phosphatase PAP2 family protein [Candidatus Eremiobacteraeota bacterium]|nr:phosphatase PAP2 family protein [Candidatus Eremiobacteraeota bacterium]